jgi:hypothetical protein
VPAVPVLSSGGLPSGGSSAKTRWAAGTPDEEGTVTLLSGEIRRPYTPTQVGILYPMLLEAECHLVSEIEFMHRGWEVWPHMSYPDVHVWLAKRQLTAMDPLEHSELGMIPELISKWNASFTLHEGES